MLSFLGLTGHGPRPFPLFPFMFRFLLFWVLRSRTLGLFLANGFLHFLVGFLPRVNTPTCTYNSTNSVSDASASVVLLPVYRFSSRRVFPNRCSSLSAPSPSPHKEVVEAVFTALQRLCRTITARPTHTELCYTVVYALQQGYQWSLVCFTMSACIGWCKTSYVSLII